MIKSRILRLWEHEARIEKRRSALKMLTGKSISKRPLQRARRRWQDNIRIDLEGIGINARNVLYSSQNRDYWWTLENAALNLGVLKAMELISKLHFLMSGRRVKSEQAVGKLWDNIKLWWLAKSWSKFFPSNFSFYMLNIFSRCVAIRMLSL